MPFWGGLYHFGGDFEPQEPFGSSSGGIAVFWGGILNPLRPWSYFRGVLCHFGGILNPKSPLAPPWVGFVPPWGSFAPSEPFGSTLGVIFCHFGGGLNPKSHLAPVQGVSHRFRGVVSPRRGGLSPSVGVSAPAPPRALLVRGDRDLPGLHCLPRRLQPALRRPLHPPPLSQVLSLAG